MRGRSHRHPGLQLFEQRGRGVALASGPRSRASAFAARLCRRLVGHSGHMGGQAAGRRKGVTTGRQTPGPGPCWSPARWRRRRPVFAAPWAAVLRQTVQRGGFGLSCCRLYSVIHLASLGDQSLARPSASSRAGPPFDQWFPWDWVVIVMFFTSRSLLRHLFHPLARRHGKPRRSRLS